MEFSVTIANLSYGGCATDKEKAVRKGKNASQIVGSIVAISRPRYMAPFDIEKFDVIPAKNNDLL